MICFWITEKEGTLSVLSFESSVPQREVGGGGERIRMAIWDQMIPIPAIC